MPGEGGRQEQGGIGHQAVVIHVDFQDSCYWVLLFWDRFSVSKPLSQMRRSTFLPLQDADPTPSFGGFGFR